MNKKTKKLRKVLSVILAVLMFISIFWVQSGNYEKASTAEAGKYITPVAAHGELTLNGTNIVDKNGAKYQLRGVSTHGINFDIGEPYVNKDAFQTLRDQWGVNAVRLVLYPKDYNGYLNGGDKTELMTLLKNGVSYATELGMYVIIDWHVLNENPGNNTEDAKTFFNDVASTYASYSNVLYEICNEPNNCTWEDIKDYANEVIPVIRKYDSNALIIVGTPTYSQLGYQGHTYEVADSPLTGYTNILYALHFYAAEWSHNEYLQTKLENTVNRGIPVFVSEYGLSEASGNGNISTADGDDWLNLMDSLNVSYFAWSLSNKAESSALISSTCTKTSYWKDEELTSAGSFVKSRYLARYKADEEINDIEVETAKGITVSYATHVQTFGWQGFVSNGKMSGTSGLAKRLEAIKIKVSGANLGIKYKTHVQTYGWQGWRYDGAESGTSGQAKRLEAICISLTGADKDKYDIYYRVHCQSYGWLGWAKNGEPAGSEGFAKRLEGINIVIVEKGKKVFDNQYAFISNDGPGLVNYNSYVQDKYWLGYVADGDIGGTSGKGLKLEAIRMNLNSSIDGGIMYQAHVQSVGWQNWAANNSASGAAGKRLEAIKIKLTGKAANEYDVYYRVHVQTFGWLGWAKNGEEAGTSGLAFRVEAIQVMLVEKGSPAPGSSNNAYIKK